MKRNFVESETLNFPFRLQLRSDLHLVRKTWHMFMGMFIAFIYLSGLGVGPSIAILSVFLALTLGVEAARLRSAAFNEKMVRLWSPIMRSCEVNRMTGTPYYLAATIIAIAIFPRPVAVLSILYLACGDPMASLFGILYGDRSIRFSNGKSLIGTLAGVMTCTLVTFVFLQIMPSLALSPAQALIATVVGGLAGGLAEMVPLDADDNFIIPTVSGFILWLAFIVLGVSG